MESIKSKLIFLIAQRMELEEAHINTEQSLRLIGVDSLEMVEIVIMVEEEFSILILDETLKKIDSVSDLAEAVAFAQRVESETRRSQEPTATLS